MTQRCVVVDTNVWVYGTRLLRTPLGAALLFELHRSAGKLGLPEVVEWEARKHVERLGANLREKAVGAHRQMLQLLGRVEEYRPPEASFAEALSARFAELDQIIVRIPISFEHARSALGMVIDEVPPNGPKNQQYKDSLIWQAVLELAATYEVDLATDDKGFFTDAGKTPRLSEQLAEEARKRTHRIDAHLGLQALLTALREQIPEVDYDAMAAAIANRLGASTGDFSDALTLGELQKHRLEAFVTEQPDVLAVGFEVELSGVLDLSGDRGAENVSVVIQGECNIKFPDIVAFDVRLMRIDVFDAAGDPLPGGGVFLQVDSVVHGRRIIDYRLKAPL